MEPINFKEATMTLTAPSSMPDTGDLPVYTDGKQCVSCWKPTWKERLSILVHGRIYLGVMGKRTQPPVWIAGTCPFFRPSIADHIRSFVNGVILAIRETLAQEDKRLHVIAGFVIALMSSMILSIAWSVGVAVLAGLVVGVIAGLAKEIRDKITQKGTPELADFLCTAAGSLIGSAVFGIVAVIINVICLIVLL